MDGKEKEVLMATPYTGTIYENHFEYANEFCEKMLDGAEPAKNIHRRILNDARRFSNMMIAISKNTTDLFNLDMRTTDQHRLIREMYEEMVNLSRSFKIGIGKLVETAGSRTEQEKEEEAKKVAG